MDPPEPPSDSPPPDAPSTVAPHNQSKAYWGKVFIRVIVLTLVVGGIWHTVDGAREEFTAKGFSPRNLNYGWLAIAGLFYLSGSLP
ncbi:MAG: hypothetical protein QGG09_19270, partial [Pirellulaceae bacterium]|nr:hypothetical protein [Pirellulaceae bacterium]